MDVNDGHYLEALDRAHTVQIMIDELLEDHAAIVAHDDLKTAYQTASGAIAELYQAVGRKLHEYASAQSN